MNNTIRESARNRNTRQNIDLFGGNPRRGRGGQRRPQERMAGLMGGGGGGGGGGAVSPDRFRDPSPVFEPGLGSSRDNGVGGLRRTRNRQPTPVVADVDTLMALEDEIHGMDTSQNGTLNNESTTPPVSNQNPNRTNQNSNRAGAANRAESSNSSQSAAPSLQPVPNQTTNQSSRAANSNDRPLMEGASAPSGGRGASNSGERQSNAGTNQGGARNGPNPRGRGRGVRRGARQQAGNNRSTPQRPGNNQQTAQPDATASNSNSNNNGLAPVSNSSSPRRPTNNAANTGLRRNRASTNVSENPPAPAARSRTFVQEEPSTSSENADLPTVSNNGLSFSINLDEVAPAPNASGNHRRGNNANNGASSGPRPSDSLTANRALNHYKRKGQVFKILGSGKGSNEGQLKWPRGLALSPINDSFLTADSSNHRVQMFDVNGEFAMKFGSYGAQEGEFDCLTGIAVNGLGEIVICDRYNNRIQVFDR